MSLPNPTYLYNVGPDVMSVTKLYLLVVVHQVQTCTDKSFYYYIKTAKKDQTKRLAFIYCYEYDIVDQKQCPKSHAMATPFLSNSWAELEAMHIPDKQEQMMIELRLIESVQ